jgi:thiamine biosynthesis protein ThiS
MADIKIFVNGVEMRIPMETSVSGLFTLLDEGRTPDMIVEINHRFVHAHTYDTTRLKEGDRIEIIHLAMGG